MTGADILSSAMQLITDMGIYGLFYAIAVIVVVGVTLSIFRRGG